MRCVFLVFLLCVISSNASDVELRVTPICVVQVKDVEAPCAFFKERSLKKLSEDSWTEIPINKTTLGNQYSNITLVFKRRSEMTSVFVLIRYQDYYPLPLQTWEIQPATKDLPDAPLVVTIAYAPHPSNMTNYRIRRILNPSNYSKEHTCNKTETNLECMRLKNSMLFMRNSWGNTLTLAISTQLLNYPLSVEVLSAPCNITCRGEINNCSRVDMRNMKWENPSEPLKIYNSANDTSPVYYCTRIAPASHDCCIIYTETILMHPENYQREISVTFSQKIYLPECFMVLSISLALLVSAMFTVRKMFGASSYRCWPYYTIGSQESVGDGLLTGIQEDTSPARMALPPALQQQNQNVEVLLIYHKNSDETGKLMAKFRYILSYYVTKVWDPLSEDEIENVNENPTMWIENILSRDQVKVILVEDRRTVEWYEQSLQDRPTFHYHHLDNLFLYFLSIIHNNPYMCLNYQRLFIIRFASSKLNIKSTNIVPCTRYEMPQNFGNLITDLVGSQVQRNANHFKPPFKEIQELEMLDREFSNTKDNLIEFKK